MNPNIQNDDFCVKQYASVRGVQTVAYEPNAARGTFHVVPGIVLYAAR